MNLKEGSFKLNETFHNYFPDMNGNYFNSAFLSFLKTKQFWNASYHWCALLFHLSINSIFSLSIEGRHSLLSVCNSILVAFITLFYQNNAPCAVYFVDWALTTFAPLSHTWYRCSLNESRLPWGNTNSKLILCSVLLTQGKAKPRWQKINSLSAQQHAVKIAQWHAL
jgi:hypothetical protein